ncbi:hypothetical protein GCM10010252_00260 [Streptomyces aureoverticillatus]|nr:hypothetical protein GCM10010252_00260 [Streptomyces aureoverticillatus]
MNARFNAPDLAPDWAWRKSSYSDGTPSSCVEVADLTRHPTGSIGIRDSKTPQGPALVLGLPAWNAFLTSVVK